MKKIIFILISAFVITNFANAQDTTCYGYTYADGLNHLRDAINRVYLGRKFHFEFHLPQYALNLHLNILLDQCGSIINDRSYYLGIGDNDLVFLDGREPVNFVLEGGRLGQQDYLNLIFVFDSNHYWARQLREDPSYYWNEYCSKGLSNYKDSIKDTFNNLWEFRKQYNGLISNLEKLKALIGEQGEHPTNLENFLKGCNIQLNSATTACALVNLNDFLVYYVQKPFFFEDGIRDILGGKPAKGEIRIPVRLDLDVTYYYDFDKFSSNNLKEVNEKLTAFNNHLYAILSNCSFWEDGLYKATNIFVKDLEPINKLTYTEYGGKIEVATVSVPIAVKPPGFFGKEFSEIKPETIYEAIKDFLFKLAPYVFTLLLIIGGLLYLLTPVSDQIKKGSEVIKWAVIGYFLLLVITGVVTLLKSVLGGP